MNEQNNKEIKNNKVKILLLIFTITVLVVGVTYAYFIVNANGRAKGLYKVSSTSSEIVVLKTLVDNLHIKMKVKDFTEGNVGSYYGTDDNEIDYVRKVEESNKKLISVAMTGAESNTEQKCIAKIKATMEGTMSDVIRPNDLILHLSIQDSNDDVDLSYMKVSKNISSTLSFTLTGNQKDFIEGYLELQNRDVIQDYLSDTDIYVKLELEDIECEIQNTVRGS